MLRFSCSSSRSPGRAPSLSLSFAVFFFAILRGGPASVARAERDSCYLTPLRNARARACASHPILLYRAPTREQVRKRSRDRRRETIRAILYAPPIRINLASRHRKYHRKDIGARYYDANEEPREFPYRPPRCRRDSRETPSRQRHSLIPILRWKTIHLNQLSDLSPFFFFVSQIFTRFRINYAHSRFPSHKNNEYQKQSTKLSIQHLR